MAVINSSNLYKIICKTLNMVDDKIMEHSEIVSYTLYKMLQFESRYSPQDMVDFAMIGILHDIGLFKTGSSDQLMFFETKNVWEHSIYGYLFLRYLSPLKEKAEIILYHHLDYNKHSHLSYPYMQIAEYLTYADKLDVYTRLHTPDMISFQEYFVKNSNKTFSAEAQQLFLSAERSLHITEHLRDGSYRQELDDLLGMRHFTEKYKRGFLEMLIYTIDFRSEYTVLHTLGTVTFAMELARLMQLSDSDSYKLYYGALLHDIGKINVPVEILESPNRLSKEEMDIMKLHATNTRTILKGFVDDDVLEIAARHHEKLDGSGYPDGLTEKDLNLSQRIIAVADILSALYQKRSYKEAFDPTKIKSILQGDADSGKIGSDIVACAISHFDEITTNYEAKRDETMGLYLQIQEQYEIIYERFKRYEI